MSPILKATEDQRAELHYSYVGKYFRDSRLKAAFTFQDMYMGMSPNSASALFSMLQYSEFADGVWFPMGGMHRVIEALVSIAENLGVQFRYGAPVKRIEVDDRRVTGVALESGERLSAKEAAETIHSIRGLDVLGQTAVVKDGAITEYRTNIRISFMVEDVRD